MDVEWTLKLPEMKLWELIKAILDHCPLLLETVGQDCGPKPFKPIDVWFLHLGIHEEGERGMVPVWTNLSHRQTEKVEKAIDNLE